MIAGRGGPVGFVNQDVVIKISCLAGQELVLGNGLDGREGVAGLLVAGPGQKGEVAVLAADDLFEGLKGLAGDLFPVDQVEEAAGDKVFDRQSRQVGFPRPGSRNDKGPAGAAFD